MAATALVRVTGAVLKVDRIAGTSHKSGSPVPYDFTQAKIVVADDDVTELTLPDAHRLSGGHPVKGELVDYLCSVKLNSSGRGLSVNALRDFPVDDAA